MRVCDRCGAAARWRINIHALRDIDGYLGTPTSETDACDTCVNPVEWRTTHKPTGGNR